MLCRLDEAGVDLHTLRTVRRTRRKAAPRPWTCTAIRGCPVNLQEFLAWFTDPGMTNYLGRLRLPAITSRPTTSQYDNLCDSVMSGKGALCLLANVGPCRGYRVVDLSRLSRYC